VAGTHDLTTVPHDARDVDVERYRRRLVSAAVAAAIGLLAAAGATFLTGWEIGYIGIPIAAVLGWGLALRLNDSGSRAVVAILWMAFGCAVLGAFAVGIVATGDLVTGIMLGALGAVFYGIPAFLLLLAPATAWALITSWLERRAA
jgi:hypothetical protein